MSLNLIRSKKPKLKKNKISMRKISKAATINLISTNANNERFEWMNKLVELRQNAVFVDSSIITSDFKKFPIDRNVFAASSPYFKALFSNTLYSENQCREVFLPDISSDIMQIITDFVYIGQLIGLNQSNVEKFIHAVNRLQITGALDYCNQYLIQSLALNNCIRIYQMSRMYYTPTVIEKAKLFILYNFSSIWRESKDFLNLTRDELSDLLNDDRLNVSREEMTYYSIVSWVSANNQRAEHFSKLFKLVRFGNSSLKFVKTIVSQNCIVSSNPELKQYIERVSSILNDIYLHPLPSKFDIDLHPFLRPRIPRDILFVFGGWSASNAINILETYDCRVNKWYSADNNSLVFAPYRAYHGMVCLNGLIYIIGGFDGRQHFNSMIAFNPLEKIWIKRSCMHSARCYVSVALCDGLIYAIGGFDGTVRTSSAERYDYKENQWEFIANMNHQRSDACATSLAGKVYIVGGFNGSEVLNSAEVYDPSVNEWTFISHMNRPRSGVQLVELNNLLYAIGGNDGISRQTSLERYEPKHKKWTLLADMNIPRSNFACAVLENLIYVIGGFNGSITISDVESYNPITNSWQEMWQMNKHKSALSACVVTQLENAKQYTWLRRELTDNCFKVTSNKSLLLRRRDITV